jgi:hypothetical protein
MGVPEEQARLMAEAAVPAEQRTHTVCGKQMSLAEVAYITLVVKSEDSELANARRILIENGDLPKSVLDSLSIEEKMLNEAWTVLKSLQERLGKKAFALNAQARQELAGDLYTQDNAGVEAAKAAYQAAIEARAVARLEKLSTLGH